MDNYKSVPKKYLCFFYTMKIKIIEYNVKVHFILNYEEGANIHLLNYKFYVCIKKNIRIILLNNRVSYNK